MKISSTPARNGSIQEGPRGQNPWGVSVGRWGGADSRERQVGGRREVSTSPCEKPRRSSGLGTWQAWGLAPQLGTLQSRLPQVSRAQTFARQPYSQGTQEPLRGQRPRRLLLREQTCVMRELTVYRAAHTQPRRLPRCLAKPAHPACWDKFPGRRHSPQVRRGELEEQPLLRSPRKK